MDFDAIASCLEARRPSFRRRLIRAARMAAFLAMLAAVGLAAGAAWGGEYRWPVVKVVNDDTLKVDAGADMPPELATLHVRLRGVNTRE